MTNTKKTQKVPVSPDEIFRPREVASDEVMPNSEGDAVWLTWVIAEMISAILDGEEVEPPGEIEDAFERPP